MSIRFSAPLKLRAKAAGARRLSIVAYSGGLMNVSGFGPLVIDLAGMTFATSLPLLADHNNAVSAVVGSGAARIEAGLLLIDGAAAATPAGREVVSLLESGTPLQASVGAEPIEKTWIEPGQSITANGRTIKAEAGFWFVTKSQLREVTVTPLGADSSTSVSLAARRAAASLRGKNMTFEEWVKEKGFDPASLTETQRAFLQSMYDAENPPATAASNDPAEAPANSSPTNAAAVAPAIQSRLNEIATICATAGNPSIVGDDGQEVPLLSYAISQGLSAGQVRREALHAIRASRPVPPQAFRPDGSAGSAGINAKHVEAAFMVKAGHEAAAERTYGGVILEQSKRLHRASFPDLCAAALRAKGQDVPHERSDMIRAAMSGGSVSTLLGNAAGKILEYTWQTAPATWRSFCAIRDASDFKTKTSIRPTFPGSLHQTPDGAEFDHGTIGEETFTWRINTYAKQFKIGRQAIVNDDLNALSELMPSFGQAALRRLSDLVYMTILANGGSFFHTDNDNVQSSGSSALQTSSLATAVKQMRMQTDPEGNTLDIMPAVLVAPPTLEVTARGLIQSAEVARVATGDNLPTANTFNKFVKLEIESRLENGLTDEVSGTAYAGSTTGWYLFASPADVPVVVGFLNGKQSPTVESFGFDSDPDRLAMTFRVYHDFGAALGDHRAAQKSAGA